MPRRPPPDFLKIAAYGLGIQRSNGGIQHHLDPLHATICATWA